MKINGHVVNAMEPKVLVIPKGNENIVFKAQPVLDYDEFDKLCPKPEAPGVLKPGGERFVDVRDSDYLKKLDIWASNRVHWMVLKSLSATPNLEWETVNMSDSTTWKNYADELTKSGFSNLELRMIVDMVITACGLNEEKIEQATKSFLAGQQVLPVKQ
jgi:hypothetical protein